MKPLFRILIYTIFVVITLKFAFSVPNICVENPNLCLLQTMVKPIEDKVPHSNNFVYDGTKIKYDIDFGQSKYNQVKLNNLVMVDKYNAIGDVKSCGTLKGNSVLGYKTSCYNVYEFPEYNKKKPYLEYYECDDDPKCVSELYLKGDGLDYYDPNMVNSSGDCDGTCYISTPSYNVTLIEGVLTEWNYHSLQNKDVNGNVGSFYVNFFQILGGSWEIKWDITETLCDMYDGGYYLNFNCSNSNAYNNYTFFEDYVQVDTKVYGNNYRIYNYFHGSWDGSAARSVQWNGTQNYSSGYHGAWDTSAISDKGVWAIHNTTNDYITVISWDESKKKTFDYFREWGSGSNENYGGMSIGRGNEISAGTVTRSYLRTYYYNDSATGDDAYVSILDCFKSNPNSTCTAAVSDGYVPASVAFDSIYNTTYNNSVNISFTTTGNYSYTEWYQDGSIKANNSEKNYTYVSLVNNTLYNFTIGIFHNVSVFNWTELIITTLQNKSTPAAPAAGVGIAFDSIYNTTYNNSVNISFTTTGNYSYTEWYQDGTMKANNSDKNYTYTALVNYTSYNFTIWIYHNVSIYNWTELLITTLQNTSGSSTTESKSDGGIPPLDLSFKEGGQFLSKIGYVPIIIFLIILFMAGNQAHDVKQLKRRYRTLKK